MEISWEISRASVNFRRVGSPSVESAFRITPLRQGSITCQHRQTHGDFKTTQLSGKWKMIGRAQKMHAVAVLQSLNYWEEKAILESVR